MTLDSITTPPCPVQEILLSAMDSSEAIRRIYESQKQFNPKMTLANICKKSGFSSRGALSDIMSGKRRLNPKFKSIFAEIFGLSEAQKICFETLVELSAAKDPVEIAELEQSLQLARKAFGFVSEDIWAGYEANDFFIMDMLGVFGLYDDKPTRDDLVNFFGREYAIIIDENLSRYVTRGVLGVETGRYFINHKALILPFKKLGERATFHKFAKKHFNLFLQNLGKNMNDPSFTFRSGVHYVSVKKADFDEFMKRFVVEFEGHVAANVADDSDAIAHMGFFMHTIEPKTRKPGKPKSD